MEKHPGFQWRRYGMAPLRLAIEILAILFHLFMSFKYSNLSSLDAGQWGLAHASFEPHLLALLVGVQADDTQLFAFHQNAGGIIGGAAIVGRGENGYNLTVAM